MIRVSVLLILLTSVFCASCSSSSEGTNTRQGTTADSTPLPQFTDARQALDEGSRLLDVNETEKAIEAFKQAVALDPDLAEAYFKLGIAYSLIENEQRSAIPGEVTEPIGDKKKGDENKPESVKAFEKAVETYKRLIEKNPDDDVSYFNLGRSLNKLNKDDDAEEALEKAVKLKPEEVEYLTELGAIRIKLAHYREAVEPLEKALQLDPENSEAQDLFDDAVAGRRRVEYKEKRDEKPDANSKAASNSSNANVAANTPASNTNSRPPANAGRPPSVPANKPSNRP